MNGENFSLKLTTVNQEEDEDDSVPKISLIGIRDGDESVKKAEE